MMERLTTNKEKSEMGMYELAHNSCIFITFLPTVGMTNACKEF